MLKCEKILELNMNNITARMTAAFYEYALKREKAEYKVMFESGGDNILEYYYKEAGETLTEKFKEFISNMINYIKTFFDDLIKSIKDKIMLTELDAVEKKIIALCKDPEISNKKIKVMDIDAYSKVYKIAEVELLDLSNKIKNKNKISANDIDDIMSKYEKGKVKVNDSMEITINDSLKIYRKYRDMIKDNMVTDRESALKKVKSYDKLTDPEFYQVQIKLINTAVKIATDRAAIMLRVGIKIGQAYKQLGVTNKDMDQYIDEI